MPRRYSRNLARLIGLARSAGAVSKSSLEGNEQKSGQRNQQKAEDKRPVINFNHLGLLQHPLNMEPSGNFSPQAGG